MKSNTLGKETQENNNTHDNASHKAQCIMQGNTTRKTKQHTRGKEARKQSNTHAVRKHARQSNI